MFENAQGDPIPDSGSVTSVFLCDCFLHDVSTQIREGYAGKGIEVNYYVNIDRRDDLEIGQEILVCEFDSNGMTVRGSGKIVDIQSTSGMQFGGVPEYTTIFI